MAYQITTEYQDKNRHLTAGGDFFMPCAWRRTFLTGESRVFCSMPNIGQQHSIEKSRQLQRNLYLAAKKDKQRRFHALYDRIFRLDILWRVWKEVRENKGSAGIDGITFEMIEECATTKKMENGWCMQMRQTF